MMMVHPLLVSNHADLQIVLEEDHVILYGTPEESAGVMLKGHVMLNCFGQTKVKSIKLKFTSIAQVSWTEVFDTKSKHKQHKAEHLIIEKEWTFIEFKKKVHCFQPGQYKWEFQLPLPGNLPISVKHTLGKIEYQFRAYCDRPAFSSNYMAHTLLTLNRMLFPLDLSDSVVISNRWAGKVNYDISIPSKWYSPDTIIPVAIDLEPIAYQLTVKSVCLTLKEYITGHVSGKHKTQGKKLRRIRDDQFVSSGDGHWIKTIFLPIPTELNFDMQSELIQVKHKITLTIALANFDGHISELKAAIPVTIAPPMEEEGNILPAYQENSPSTLAYVSYSQLPSYSPPFISSDIRCGSDVLPTYESAITA
ncbi:hypothetical protein EDC96DRAFT_518103 [Choanephora cucurbitarum]|nr:hypothetical protein EDC96DRAFT_518103 [Choanephora cucurbitarum]